MNYPRRAKKKPVKEEHVCLILSLSPSPSLSHIVPVVQFAVGVVEIADEQKLNKVLIQKRPDSGTLFQLHSNMSPFHTIL